MDLGYMESRTRLIADAEIKQLAAEIDRNGFVRVPNFVDLADLKRMQDFVQSAVSRSGHEYVLFKGAEQMAGSGLDDLAHSPRFQSIFSRLYEESVKQPAPPVTFYQILRCLTGKGMAKHSMHFHYDSYVITALIPVEIPSEGAKGDLLVFPSTRRLRRSYLVNLVDKLLLENAVAQRVFRWLSSSGRMGVRRITMVPGDLYLFWGYRSIHTNEPCDPFKVRATALFHYADPHASSRVKAALRRG